jgi:hypothetical protein
MTNGIQIDIYGIPGVREKLNGIRESVEKRIVGSSLRFAIKPLVPAVRNAAPSKFGVLRRSIGIRVKQYKAVFFAAVGPLTKYKETTAGTFPFPGPKNVKPRVQQPSKIAHLIEDGTKPHFIPAPGYGRKAKLSAAQFSEKSTPGWQHPGTKAQPFIAPTSAKMQNTVLRRFADQVARRVDAEYKKAVKKGSKFWSADV